VPIHVLAVREGWQRHYPGWDSVFYLVQIQPLPDHSPDDDLIVVSEDFPGPTDGMPSEVWLDTVKVRKCRKRNIA